MVEGKRLHDEVGCATLDGRYRVLDRAVPGDDHRDDFRVAFERELDDLGTVDARQSQIGNDGVEREVRQEVAGYLATLRLGHAEAVLDQSFRGRFAERRLVLDEEQMPFLCRHCGSTRGECRYFDARRRPRSRPEPR